MDVHNKFHDAEIIAICHIDNSLILVLNNLIKLIFDDVEYWEMSAFEFQNVIFEINIYSINNMPAALHENYTWLTNYLHIRELQIAEIDSSVGLYGIIVFKNFKQITENFSL